MSVEVREREKKQQGKKKKVQYLGARSRNVFLRKPTSRLDPRLVICHAKEGGEERRISRVYARSTT